MQHSKMVWIYTVQVGRSISYGIEPLHVMLRKVSRVDAKALAAQEVLHQYGSEYADKARKINAATGQCHYFGGYARHELDLHFQRNVVDCQGYSWYGGRVETCSITREVANGLGKLAEVNRDNPQECLDALKAVPVEYLDTVSEYVPASAETLAKYAEILTRGKVAQNAE
jgi:hypothetical protein